MEGALNYIWEGDPYPHIRQYLDALASISKQLSDEKLKIYMLQEALEWARLDSVNDGGEKMMSKKKILLFLSRGNKVSKNT